MKNTRPCLLMILDGWGKGSEYPGNAVITANTPNLDFYMENYAVSELQCSGEAVGLPSGVMGNSEVGHLNIGAGRVVYQDLLRIDKSIEDRSFFSNKALNRVFDETIKNNGKIHFFGLLSDGRVHSSLNHLDALIEISASKNIKTVIHPIMDGRDTPPKSGMNFIGDLEKKISSFDNITIGTVCGRFYAMDRDKRWERVEKAYNLYAKGEGKIFDSPVEAVSFYYENEITDEFIEPSLIKNTNGIVEENDGIVFFNFRADRAREITRAFTSLDFIEFERKDKINLSGYVCMTVYDAEFDLDAAFPPVTLKNNLGEFISSRGLTQLRIAETEKYAHVTYFFNGGSEEPYSGEERILIPSPRDVETYDKKPEMSAKEVCSSFLKAFSENSFSLCVLNYANMDMVGHTGVFDAAVKACETVDECVKPLVDAVLQKNGFIVITADHGNSEKMFDSENGAYTAHTTNPVNLILIENEKKHFLKKNGKLGDIAPTILEIMGFEKPEEMTGESLLRGYL
ncbi:MAG: 2,3-bisphosphoglycerate-independent phosphoglycerate mutase [Desulfobacteraceae bacterium]|nr:2,3-bisphosphoglycerate-independent phosphoglycerate mutase [Desulfobacteraceae bacterium]MCB9494130.1 2,3-bisphosphoglycerate-independent phosphoglycerate mutase [Desulfobacteraceae bacterium]